MNMPFLPRNLALAIGLAVRAARRRRGLPSQKALAERARLNLRTIAKLEAGRGTVPSLVTVLATLEHRFAEQPSEIRLGQWLAERRGCARLRQDGLADRAGVSKPTISKVEHEKGQVTSLGAVMNALELSLALRPDEQEAHPIAPPFVRKLIHRNCIEVMQSLPAGSIDLIVTSPPYNIGKEYEKRKLSLDEFKSSVMRWLREVVRVLSDHGSCWINLSNTKDPNGNCLPLDTLYLPLATEAGLLLRQRLIWYHRTGKPQVTKLTHVHECWLWFTKMPKGFTWNLDEVRVVPKTGYDDSNPCGANPTDVWDFSTLVYGSRKRLPHPCPFPVEMIQRIIKLTSNEGDEVLDPFGGVGSTAIAATLEKRSYISIEKEVAYHRVAERRLAHVIATGKDMTWPRPPRKRKRAEDSDEGVAMQSSEAASKTTLTTANQSEADARVLD
jgi:adenine-specific DNA-methyltransferase